MDKPKIPKEELSVMEAVDQLSSMAELDLAKEPEKVIEAKDLERNRETVKETFRVIRKYLQHLYETHEGNLDDPNMQKGVHAIMSLAGEAARKVDKLAGLFKEVKGESVLQLPEYQDLQQFYVTKIKRKIHESIEKEEEWHKEWGTLTAEDLLDIQKRGLKDLETIRRDKEYELFYIKKEDGRPFFNRNLLRHIRLVGDFDETITDPEGQDPFLRVKLMQDKESHFAAKEILTEVKGAIDEFYKEAMRHKDDPFIESLIKATMALMLAANPRNLMANTTGKSSVRYFDDFRSFFRATLMNQEYGKWLSMDRGELEPFQRAVLHLTFSLGAFFFLRKPDKGETIELIHKLIKRKEEAKRHGSPLSFWHQILEDDESLRNLLKHYPSGPLLKTLDVFKEEDELLGFDPLGQENLPYQLFAFSNDAFHVDCLRIPTPTRQEFINRGEVVEEFMAFLRGLKLEIKGKKFLMFNLQDRTSWKEHIRCILLEDLQKEAEFADTLCVVTLPKSTEFYLQTGPYATDHDAETFKRLLHDQIASAESCGFYFPPAIEKNGLLDFVDKLIPMLHESFFGGKETLSRKNRLDFIEIFYLFLQWKIVEIVKPDSLSLTCKDAIDVGATASSSLYAFIRLLGSQEAWKESDENTVLWMTYASSLLYRERAVDEQAFSRMVSALSVLNAEFSSEPNKILTVVRKLYQPHMLKEINLS